MKSLHILCIYLVSVGFMPIKNLHSVIIVLKRADVLDSGLAFVIIRLGQIRSPYGLASKGRDNKWLSPLARILGTISLFIYFMYTRDWYLA